MHTDNYFSSNKKRFFDITLGIFLITLISPILIMAIPLFFIIIGNPIIFRQKRFGKNKNIFTIYKIKTMKTGSEKIQDKLKNLNIAPYPMFKIKNDPRFTPLGKTLSKFGLDELPQIINILKGEMSFVGPRPLPVNEAKKLNDSWDFRYSVRPGILSKWALSSNRYKSLNSWKKLEKETLKINSAREEFKLVLKAINQVIIRNILTSPKKT